MALTYAQSAALMQDGDFIARVKVACMKYADFILNEPTSTAAHNTRLRWAQQTMNNPDMAAQQTTPPTVMDAAVQADGGAITDANLQSAVETTINRMICHALSWRGLSSMVEGRSRQRHR